MNKIEMMTLKGIDVWQVLDSFDDDLRQAIWVKLINHPLWTESDDAIDFIIVSGKWLRKFIGHVAVDEDALGQFRRQYPPVTDNDVIFIKKIK